MAVQEFDAALVPAERRSRTAERWMWGIVGTLLIVTFIDLALRGPLLEIPLYVGGNMLLLPFLGIGLFYRLVRPDERIASTALCFVALAMFTHVGASVNHAFLPLWRPTIDGTLAAWDAAIGMHWPSAMALAAEYPLLSRIGGLIYASSIPQIMLTLFVLGLSGLRAQLERFVLAAMLGACAAIAFWIVFPSFGPSTLYDLPDEVVRAVDPIVGPRYGAELLQLGREGMRAGIEAKGLIAFPSYHTVLALLVPLALWPVRWLRWPALAVNLAMLPAVIVHGGHFVVDLIGGAVLLAAVWAFVCRLVPWDTVPHVRRPMRAARA